MLTSRSYGRGREDKRSGRERRDFYGSPASAAERRSGRERRRKTSTISFRISNELKERLQAVAGKEGRTLSSLLDRILQGFLHSQEGRSCAWSRQDEKRGHPRKEVLLPARWKISQGERVVEHDVLVKNIGVGGAYTESVSGQSLKLFENLQAAPLSLVVRMPGSEQAVELDCEARRVHITKEAVGVGLRFVESLPDNSLMA